MSELEAIREIGRYQIVRQIGRGGMARVYLARDPRLRRYVAIKVIAADTHSDEYFRRAFEREAGAIGSLQHPNILPVYDIGEHDGHSYMVMHYVEGGRTLRDVITASRLEPAQAGYTLSQ
ncbi:MAG: protein kinase, partial [Chloroflexi bacterium]|nr:protein kinase [Chloroflexota bacterium]